MKTSQKVKQIDFRNYVKLFSITTFCKKVKGSLNTKSMRINADQRKIRENTQFRYKLKSSS